MVGLELGAKPPCRLLPRAPVSPRLQGLLCCQSVVPTTHHHLSLEQLCCPSFLGDPLPASCPWLLVTTLRLPSMPSLAPPCLGPWPDLDCPPELTL